MGYETVTVTQPSWRDDSSPDDAELLQTALSMSYQGAELCVVTLLLETAAHVADMSVIKTHEGPDPHHAMVREFVSLANRYRMWRLEERYGED